MLPPRETAVKLDGAVLMLRSVAFRLVALSHPRYDPGRDSCVWPSAIPSVGRTRWSCGDPPGGVKLGI